MSNPPKPGIFRVEPGNKVRLKDFDPDDTSGMEKGKDEKLQVEKLHEKLRVLQEKLYAMHDQKVLVVLQGMDTAGKDGVITHVFQGVNPQGVRVAHFGKPSDDDLDHDFLWRVHKEVPRKGEMVLFNRSHYEDVIIGRVHKLVPDDVWKQRYDQINDFEKLLVQTGTKILKFYLHISKDEQKKRLKARLDDPTKEWKFSTNDLPERKFWDEYMEANEDAISKTSTRLAPWYLIPANHKWYRDLAVSSIIVDAMDSMNLKYPQLKKDSRPTVE